MANLILKFDGGSRGNPGIGGSGFVIIDCSTGNTILEGYKYLGDNITNNVAEYNGLLMGLENLSSIYTNDKTVIEQLYIQGDSLLIINQMIGKFKVNAPGLIDLYMKCMGIFKTFKSIEFVHIKRDLNKDADRLANIAMTSKSSLVR